MTVIRRFPRLIIAALFATAGILRPALANDVATSWEKAVVYVPGETDTFRPSTIGAANPLPVVVYLHGCGGLASATNAEWGKFMRDRGFIVVQPDSRARRDRGRSCDGATLVHQNSVHDLRLQEAEYAFLALKNVKWADGRNIFLMGFSEGAIAAARTKVDGFRGIIVSSWTCTDRVSPLFHGLMMPKSVPVLTIGWASDPWYSSSTPYYGSCADRFDGRTNARHLTLPGRGHETSRETAAQLAVETFLKEHLRR